MAQAPNGEAIVTGAAGQCAGSVEAAYTASMVESIGSSLYIMASSSWPPGSERIEFDRSADGVFGFLF
jgi:hypothetical protein